MEAIYLDTEKDQHRNWYSVEGIAYAICSDGTILDTYGVPVDDCNVPGVRAAIEQAQRD